jgi:hypothetical protein
MTLVKIENGRKYDGIQYVGNNLNSVTKWGEGRVVIDDGVLTVYNPKGIVFPCFMDQWLIRHGEFIFVYTEKEIAQEYMVYDDAIDSVENVFDGDNVRYFAHVKALYDEFTWRLCKYKADKFITDLVFQHYIGRIKFIGLDEKIEQQIIQIFIQRYK